MGTIRCGRNPIFILFASATLGTALLVSKQPEGILQVDLEDVFMPLRMQLSMGEGARKGKRAGETGKIVYKYGMCWNDRKSLTATRMLRSWRVGDQGRRRCFGI